MRQDLVRGRLGDRPDAFSFFSRFGAGGVRGAVTSGWRFCKSVGTSSAGAKQVVVRDQVAQAAFPPFDLSGPDEADDFELPVVAFDFNWDMSS